ncbi:MAG: hypothetical protein HDS14_08515 [Bacteroides sp.]|nr:hypothetical protein [Bacteroides sp.]
MLNRKNFIFPVLLGILTIASCRSHKPAVNPVQAIPVENTDNTRLIHIETIDTVFIELPPQTAERTTPAKTSHLETTYAESDARINDDGTLTHTLRNKPTPIPIPLTNTRDSIIHDRMTEKPIPVEIPVPVEKELTTWQKTRLATWPYLLTALTASLLWSLRKPLLTLARRLI